MTGSTVLTTGTPVYCCWEFKMIQLLLKTDWQFFKLNLHLHINSFIQDEFTDMTRISLT